MMTLADLVQVGVVLTGATAVYLHGCKTTPVKRWGIVASLCAEPLWLYGAIATRQWGVVVMVGIYSLGWLRGLYNHFWLPYRASRVCGVLVLDRRPPEPPPCPDDTPCYACPHVVACTAYLNATS